MIRSEEQLRQVIGERAKQADTCGTGHALDPKEEKLFLNLGNDREAIVTIQVKTRGLGAIDPPTRRAPTAKELHDTADLLARRVYQFHPVD